ncbi:MAG: hypothetical protein R3B91_04935 [Planctomycetaceae bacterium]
MTTPPRYMPSMPLPPYTYVPGRTPHPIRDPAGHMYGKHEQSAELDIENWQRCDQYLFGIDLFNHGYYWEAHGLGIPVARRGTHRRVADF